MHSTTKNICGQLTLTEELENLVNFFYIPSYDQTNPIETERRQGNIGLSAEYKDALKT
jgi:hypothetical protein